MNDDHYAPPVAIVSDVTDEIDRPRPRQVTWAICLLWATLILWVHEVGFGAVRAPASAAAVQVLLTSLTVALAAYVYLSIYRGRNWARILILILTILSTAAVLFGPTYSTDSTLERVLTAVKATSDVICMYLLFASPGSTWFRRRAR